MTHVPAQPAAQASYRVPRSTIDSLFAPGQQLAPVRVGAGVVVSVELETCTVLMWDQEIPGVVFLGDPPHIGTVVEVWQADDLLYVPNTLDDDTYVEGYNANAPHIVDDSDPGTPPDEDVNIAGSMRDPSSWYFLPPDAPTWASDLLAVGTGLQITAGISATVATNLLAANPSGEVDAASWATDPMGGTAALATVEFSADHASSGSRSVKILWPDLQPGTTSSNVSDRLPVAVVAGQVVTVAAKVWVPTGSPDVRLAVTGLAASDPVTTRDQWVDVEVVWTAAADVADFGVGLTTDAPTSGTFAFLDDVMVRFGTDPLPGGLRYFDGSFPEMGTYVFGWTGVPHASQSVMFDRSASGSGSIDPGELWSAATFACVPGETFYFDTLATWQAGTAATMVPVVCWGREGDQPDPLDSANVVTEYGAPVVVTSPDTPMHGVLTAPVGDIVGATGDPYEARSGRVGIRFRTGVSMVGAWDAAPVLMVWDDPANTATWDGWTG